MFLICKHCAKEIRETSDPNVPFVHRSSLNGYCDVSMTADAVDLAELNFTGLRTEAVPA